MGVTGAPAPAPASRRGRLLSEVSGGEAVLLRSFWVTRRMLELTCRPRSYMLVRWAREIRALAAGAGDSRSPGLDAYLDYQVRRWASRREFELGRAVGQECAALRGLRAPTVKGVRS